MLGFLDRAGILEICLAPSRLTTPAPAQPKNTGERVGHGKVGRAARDPSKLTADYLGVRIRVPLFFL